MGNDESISKQVRGFLQADPYFREFLPGHFDDSTSLVDLGVFDSLSIVTLVGFLEEKFSITVNVADIIEKNFDSVERITAYVGRKTSDGPPTGG